MSWYIRSLMTHRMEIKSSAFSSSDVVGQSFDDDGLLAPMVFGGFESDAYNDLLLVEVKIAELHREGVLDDEDIELLNVFSWNPTMKELERKTETTSVTCIRKFVKICNILAMHLGGIFTDKGYVEYLRTTYSLTETQVKTLEKKIKLGTRFKINKTNKRRMKIE